MNVKLRFVFKTGEPVTGCIDIGVHSVRKNHILSAIHKAFWKYVYKSQNMASATG